MKKKYALEDLKAGVVFTADVFIDGDSLFVPGGVAVRPKDIENLQRWGVAYVYSEGEIEKLIAQPKTIGISQGGKNTLASVVAGTEAFGDSSLYHSYSVLVQGCDNFLTALRKSESLKNNSVDDIARDIISLVQGKETIVVSAILASDIIGYEMAKSAVNCAILSVVVGISMKLPSYKLNHLAVGSLLHDAGMLRIPKEIVEKKEKLTPEEAQKIRAHPLLSYRVIVKDLHYPEDVGLIGLQHHERWDGEGYPRKTAGINIDQLARIVSVTDAFEAMISEKPYRNSMIGYTAMKSLLSDNARRFDPDVLKAFLRGMGIYPIGSLVVLNNAAIARVVETHADAPLRPRIKIIVDEFGKAHKESGSEVLDLLTEKTLFIARAIDPRELAV